MRRLGLLARCALLLVLSGAALGMAAALHVPIADAQPPLPQGEPLPHRVFLPVATKPRPAMPGRIYFSRYEPPYYEERALYAKNPDGSDAQPIATNGARYAFGDVARDGRHLLVTLEAESWDVALIEVDGGNPRVIVAGPGDERATSLAPDGKQVLYESLQNGTEQVFVANVDGTGVRLLTPGERTWHGSFSPDGKRIAYIREIPYPYDDVDDFSAVYVMNADGSNPVRLTWLPGIEETPTWSLDGQTLYFTHLANLNAEYVIRSIQVDGTGMKTIVTNAEVQDISPDGKQLLFIRLAGEYHYHLFTINVDGTNVKNITNSDKWEWGARWGIAPP